MPPFAAPLATGDLQGSVNVATHPNEGPAKHAACTVRGPQILNICQLYGQGPVVLALFIEGSACDGVLAEMQTLVARFPGVRFAAVALKGERSSLRELVRSRGLTSPWGSTAKGSCRGCTRWRAAPRSLRLPWGGRAEQGAAHHTLPRRCCAGAWVNWWRRRGRVAGGRRGDRGRSAKSSGPTRTPGSVGETTAGRRRGEARALRHRR